MMNIVLATDNNFVQHCCVAMASVLKHNDRVCFYILTEGLIKKNETIINQVCKDYGGVVTVVTITSEITKKLPMPSNAPEHISIATYYRLFIEDLIPQEVNKVLYLDCDIVVRGSLKELWNTDISDYAIAAVYSDNEFADKFDTWKRLNIPRECGYFNAGVLLINLRYWRLNNIRERLFSFINNKFDRIHFHDQDVLNAVLYNETMALNCTWNFLPLYFDVSNVTFPSKICYLEKVKEIEKDPKIVHYVYRPKPWEYGCSHKYKADYYMYLSMTPFSGWKPSFNWKGFYNYLIRPKLTAIVKTIIRIVRLNK